MPPRSFFLPSLVLAASALPAAAAGQSPQPELAALIERLTSREVAGWQMSKSADGTVAIDTAGGFQHVALAASDEDGLHLGCVASLAEAKAFFGRDIASGKPLPGRSKSGEAQDTLDRLETLASRHGMSGQEYRFYTDMIERWKAGGAKAGATISIVNNDGAGEGFNSTASQFLPAPGNDGNANLGAQRLALFEAAADVWAAFLDSSVTIRVSASFDPLSCPGNSAVLGSAGTQTIHRDFTGATLASTFYHASLANKLSGSDLSLNNDISTQFNSNIDAGCLNGVSNFYYGLDNTTPGGTTNLFVVVLHELGHGLGFSSFTDQDGAFLAGFPDVWSHFQFDASTSELWKDMASNDDRRDSAINTGNLLWNGPSVRQASSYLTAGRESSTGRVQLNAPNPYRPGSSVSHYSTALSPNVLMEPSINPGLSLDLDLTRQLMRDIGWFRDSNLDGVADTITNVLPSGSTVMPGQDVTISWTQTSGFDRNVTIELSTDGGSTWPTVIAENVGNTGSRSWTVPNTPTTQARIRVREHDFVAPAGSSAANFTIASNASPSFSPASALSRQRGSSAGSATTVGTVSDAETAASALTVQSISGGSSSGISADPVSNSNGTVSAVVTASCNATAGTLRFEVSDGTSTGTGDLQVNLTSNAPPTLSYAAASVDGGSGRTISPATGPSDNGTITAIGLVNQSTFSGTISVDASGVVTVGSAAPIGTHAITVRATDNCNQSTDASFNLTVDNTAPSFTPAAAVARQQGSPAGAAVTVGTVSDAQTPVGSLSVNAIGGGSSSGLVIGTPSNAFGTISATVAAGCSATTGTQRFQVSDGSLTGTGDLQVNVSDNTPPSLGYPDATLGFGASDTVMPSTAPSDNGSIDTLTVASKGSFTGTATVNGSGVVSLGNAGPIGTHTLTIRATDNCGATRDATLQVEVPNTAPQFTAAAAISRQQGSPAGAAVTVGTVSDAESPAGTLGVTAVAGGSGTGLLVGTPSNSSGTISATVAAACTAATGTQRFEVSDGSLSDSGDLQVNVSANSPPALVYGNRSVALAGGAVISPSAGPSDNGSVEDLQLIDTGTYLGGITLDGAGVLTVTNAAPAGSHTITVRATDNCGATRDASFQLGVDLTNTPPGITPATGISVQQGSPPVVLINLASVSDAESAAGDLMVSLGSGGSVAGMDASDLQNVGGAVTATLAASCAATAGTLQLVADDGTDSASGLVDIAITANTAPQVGQYPDPWVVTLGATRSLLPDLAASDNGSIEQVSAIVTGSPGVLSAVGTTGELQLVASGAAGDYPVEVRFRDNCGLETSRGFTLRLGNTVIFEDGFETP